MTRDRLIESLASGLRKTPARVRKIVAPVSTGVQGIEAPQQPKKPRFKLSRISYGEEDWKKLYAAIAKAGHPVCRILQMQMLTGARVGDVLRIERQQLQEALESGILNMVRKGGRVTPVAIAGAQEHWQKLYELWPKNAPTVAQWVSPGSKLGAQPGGGAYQACNRKLKALGKALGIKGRIHLHRIRRTVAVTALGATGGDLKAVGDLLGHASAESTAHYVDEFRAKETAELTKKLTKKVESP